MPGAGAGILKKALISYRGTTDALGTATSLECAALATKPDYNNQSVIILDGNCKGQSRDINAATTGGTVHVGNAFDHVIAAGVHFLILSLKPATAEVASIRVQTAYIEDSVSGATTNAWADALDLDYRGVKNGSFEIENTDAANSLDYKVLERVADYAGGADEELQASVTLAFGEKAKVNLEYAHSRIKIQVQDTIGGTHADYAIRYLLNR